MNLTIGMATYDDYDGVFFTVQSLRLYHAQAVRKCELIIVDNHPGSIQGKAVEQFLGWVRGDFFKVRYIPLGGIPGTAAPRQKIFELSASHATLCLDCHVLLWPNSLQRLLDYYQRNGYTNDLLSGPMVYDNLTQQATNFSDTWAANMWGQWHTDPRGAALDAKPFEIPAMGLGCFTCRTGAWQGFNPMFRGFGGEEWYIHEKFRRSGATCLCLPFLRWNHRYDAGGRAGSHKTVGAICRNYAIGLTELGISLERCHEHFVVGGRVPQAEWDRYVQEAGVDGHGHTDPVLVGGPGTELMGILQRLGIEPGEPCDCRGKALQMDRWGVKGCRQNMATIIHWLKEGAPRWGWLVKARAAVKSITSGMVLFVNPADPFPSLVEEAIRRAEAKATTSVDG